jgi:hypothetical protein
MPPLSHFDSLVASPRLAIKSASLGGTQMSYIMVTLVLATLFGLDAFETALAIFIAAFLIHLCRWEQADAAFAHKQPPEFLSQLLKVIKF